MNTILIDGEPKELDLLNQKITQLSNIEVLGAFINPHQGLIEVSIQQPDVLFLDISIPEVNWIKVVRQLKNAIPEMRIVFLAKVDRYALEAFDIEVDDYLLRPVDESRLKQAISKIAKNKGIQKPSYKPMIGCFQKLHFRYYNSDKGMLDVKWRTSKAQEIFAYLIHHRGELVRKDVLVNLFWPDASVTNAFTQLYSTIYQIRKTLASIECDMPLISSENSYRLELNHYVVDVDVWEEGIQAMPLITAENVEAHKKLLFLYKGAYFKEENYMWAMNKRNSLRVQWINQLKRVVNYYLSIDSYGEAILLYLYYQKVNPFVSESYIELMKLYAHFDDRYAVEEQYHLLKKMSEDEFGGKPEQKIETWYRNWKKNI